MMEQVDEFQDRGNAATLMFAQGVHPDIVQEILGYSGISMILDT